MAMPFYIPVNNIWKTSGFSVLSTAFDIVTVLYIHSSNRYVVMSHCDFSHMWFIICYVADQLLCIAIFFLLLFSHSLPFPCFTIPHGIKKCKKKKKTFLIFFLGYIVLMKSQFYHPLFALTIGFVVSRE